MTKRELTEIILKIINEGTLRQAGEKRVYKFISSLPTGTTLSLEKIGNKFKNVSLIQINSAIKYAIEMGDVILYGSRGSVFSAHNFENKYHEIQSALKYGASEIKKK